MTEKGKADMLAQRIADGSIAAQKAWKFIKELNSDDEQLNATALITGEKKYSYRQMFCAWDKYAAVFSALSISGKDKSRAGFACISTAEAVFALYGLNMTGAAVYAMDFTIAFNIVLLEYYIKKNKITDFIASDALFPPANLRKLMEKKEELGLKNIIMLHSNAAGPVNTALTAFYNESNAFMLHKIEGVAFMDELLTKYEGYPVTYGTYRNSAVSIVLQTSGTTKGAHKPVPHSDYSFNNGALMFMKNPELFPARKNAVVLQTIGTFEASYSAETMLHMPFARGFAVVVNYGVGILPNALMKLVTKYHVNCILANNLILDGWMSLQNLGGHSLDSVDYIAVGGSYLSADKRKEYNNFLKEHGCKTKLINGYGMSELCGACIVSPPEQEDDSIGYPMPGVKIKVKDQNDGTFYTPEDGSRVGELYISAPSMAFEKLDGETWSERIEIDGENFLRTNDLVYVQENGCLSYAGRTNRFFTGNSDIRFDAGRVEAAVSAQKGIHDCAMIPRFIKPLHDTVPVLCVKITGRAPERLAVLHRAMCNVFIGDGLITESNLPTYCVITDNILYNSNGKVDDYRMTKGDLKGQFFIVRPIRVEKKLVDIMLVPVSQQSDYDPVCMPEEIEEECANGFLDLLDRYAPWLAWLERMPRF